MSRSQQDLARKAEKSARRTVRATKKMGRSFNDLSSEVVKLGVMMAAAWAAAFPIRDAIEFQAAMADVAKVVDFPEPDGLKKMGDSIKKLATELPITQKGLAEIVAAGGQLGVPADELAGFAELASKMSIAFDILPAAAGESMAKLSNIFNIPVQQMERVGDAINFVSNNAAASAGEIVTALRSGAGAAAITLGLTANQAIALSTQFIAQGLSATEAGTRVQVLARNLKNASKTTKLLGKNFTKLVASSPQKAIEKLMKATKDGLIPSSKLTQLLGLTVNDFVLLSKNSEKYQRILGLMSDETKFAGSMNKEFAARASTVENKLILAGNAVTNLGISIGNPLLPAIGSVLEGFADIINITAQFTADNPASVKAVMAIVTALVAVRLALQAAKIAQIAFNFAAFANPWVALGTFIVSASALVVSFKDELKLLWFIIENTGASLADWLTPDFGRISDLFGDILGGDNAALAAPAISPGQMSAAAAGTAMQSGKVEVDINLSGNTDAVNDVTVESAGGNLGVNMAGAF